MTSNDLKVLEIIWDWGGEASIDVITRETGISTDYARLICESLGRDNYIDFLHSKLCKLRGRGKLEVAKRKASGPQKVVIPEQPSKFGLGKDKRGRFILGY